jgi:cysteinyl-tRNA synthetase
MSIRIYNTLTKQKEPFEPVAPGKVSIYLCGPTVYKPSHIGHAVGPIIFDAITRYLKVRGYQIIWIVNVTDVDDKLIVESRQQNRPMLEIAREVEAAYRQSMGALGVRGITAFPRATEHIDNIIELVKRLIDKGAAYAAPADDPADKGAKDVYFDHTAAKDYGKLSGRRTEDQLAGTRTLAGENRRHPADFALWKASKADEPAWDSPWGKGRPGWHIECSAMSLKLLGETFDIHGGGMDLIFPHHENEIAQSETATGKPFAKYWMHNGLTRVATKAAGGEVKAEKMSKSLGNIRTISSLLETFTGEAIRYFVISTHYRRPLDFSDEQLAAAGEALKNFYRVFEDVQRVTGVDPYSAAPLAPEPGKDLRNMLVGVAPGLMGELENLGLPADAVHFVGEVKTLISRFFDAMDDDFNTASAIATLHEMNSLIGVRAEKPLAGDADPFRDLLAGAAQALVTLGRILGLFESRPRTKAAGVSDEEIQKLIDERNAARKTKNFARADEIRKQLSEAGITIEDTAQGTIFRRQS